MMSADDSSGHEKVSVIVVNYNSAELLEKCLCSLQGQTIRPDKTIVIDNGSSGDTAEDIAKRHPDVSIISLAKNIGFAAANNLAVQKTDTELIVFLNPDAFPEPEWLATLVGAVRSHPEYTFFASRLVNARHPHIMDGTGDLYHVSGFGWRKNEGDHVSKCSGSYDEVFSPCAAAALFRRNYFLEVGGFDERFFCFFEDLDLGFRLRLAGHKCLYIHDAVVHHFGSGTTGRHSDFSIYYGHRNLVWTYIKNMPGILFWIYLPQHLLLNLISLLWFSCSGRGGVIFKAKAAALKGIPYAFRERLIIQAGRKAGIGDLRRFMTKGFFKPYLRSLKSRIGYFV